MSIDWPTAIRSAEDAGRAALQIFAAQGIPAEVAGPLAGYAAVLTFHGPAGSPSGALACRVCRVSWPCPPVSAAGGFDPGIQAVIRAHAG